MNQEQESKKFSSLFATRGFSQGTSPPQLSKADIDSSTSTSSSDDTYTDDIGFGASDTTPKNSKGPQS